MNIITWGQVVYKSALSAIIRRDLFQEVGGFKPIRMVAGDNENGNTGPASPGITDAAWDCLVPQT